MSGLKTDADELTLILRLLPPLDRSKQSETLATRQPLRNFVPIPASYGLPPSQVSCQVEPWESALASKMPICSSASRRSIPALVLPVQQGHCATPKIKVDGFANATRKSLWRKFCPSEVLEEVVEPAVSLERGHQASSSFVRLLFSRSER